MNAKRLTGAALCLLLGLAAAAQPTLEECRRLARENYPSIRRYALVEQTRQYSLSNAAKAWMPQVAVAAQATWQNKVPAFPEQMTALLGTMGLDMPGLRKDQYRVAVDVSQTVWDGGQSRADRQMVRAEAQEQRSSLDVEMYEVESRVEELYFGMLLLDNRIDLIRQMIGLLDSNLEKVRSLVRNGVATPSDADVLEAEKLAARQTLSQLQASRSSYRIMLGHFIGTEIAAGRPLSRPAMEEPRTLVSRRPELGAVDARIGVLDARERQVGSSVLPRFSLFGQGFYGCPGLDYFASMLGSGWSWNALVGVRMTWNLSAFYTKKNNLAGIRAARDAARVQKEVFLFNTGLQTDRQNGEIARLREALRDDDRIVELRRSVREAAESELRNGVADTYELLRKITDEHAASLARSAHEVELLKAVYELRHTVNSEI